SGGSVSADKNNGAVITVNGTTTNETLVNITNKGTIQNTNTSKGFGVDIIPGNSKTITISNFTNEGLITSYKEAVVLRGDSKNGYATIENFKNTGTLHSDNSSGAYIQGVVKTFENSGTVEGTNGINIVSGGKVETIINNGILQGKTNGIIVQGTLTNLINYGTIVSEQKDNYYGGGFLAKHGTFSTLTNKGVIKGLGESGEFAGIGLYNSKFELINNESLITSVLIGINLSHINGQGNTGSIVNNSGTIMAEEHGIYLAASTQLGTIKNSGVISSKNGIRLYDIGWGTSKPINVASIENSGAIIASEDGLSMADGRTNDDLSGMTIENF
ncbi:hypothetical protein, partial [Campylobacter jejuni]|uniref:hypothetical protein n=1 Tax=Campylobacter jejuni TaxID=197 RepID=UPI000577B0EE